VEVELESKSNSLGESHAPPAWILALMDFPQPYCKFVDQYIEPYSNAWASQVLKLKIHEKTPHAEIDSSSNPMDSLQHFLFAEVWSVPSWESIEASTLASYMDVLPSYFHV
jgi:hypothetical protein